MSQNPNLFLSVGKQIKDEYGRAVGKVASFAVAPSGRFDAVFIEKSDGKFPKHSLEHLKIDGADVTLLSEIKTRAKLLCDQIPLIWRKDQAIKELSEKKRIPRELYEELHGNFDGALTQLRTEVQSLTEEINHELDVCAEEISALNYALVNLEIEHEIGKIDDRDYQIAFDIIQDNLRKIKTEKGDLELTRTKLSNITLGETSKTTTPVESIGKSGMTKISSSTNTTPGLPEPPVVVYVKEIGKTGI